MTHHKHLVQIFRSNRRIGSGVRLTKYFALTAAHCLGDDEEKGKRPVMLRLPGGRRLEGEVKEFDLLSDMALVRIVFRKGEGVALPGVLFGVARRHDSWAATHRPPGNGVGLRGTVAHVSVIYQSTRDQAVNSHRLRHDGSCDVRKYSGSPIDLTEPDRPPVVLGLLVARPATTDAPADTLFAGTIEEAVRRFDLFKFRLLRAQQTPPDPDDIYTVVQEPQAEALARKDRTVPAELERAGVNGYVNLRWHHRP
ncbi:serine protease [Streptomyces sp. NPDC050844]|uniref:S1 family peptidase n=1 Tax=Streptomyces sp. NPDC050844 TaxID=3155790 RepID=UPI0034047514